jgi:hypothetical protein
LINENVDISWLPIPLSGHVNVIPLRLSPFLQRMLFRRNLALQIELREEGEFIVCIHSLAPDIIDETDE